MKNRKIMPAPGMYWVDTKEGGFWRSKRGTFTETKLNAEMQEMCVLSKQAGPAAKAIRERLHPFLSGLETGRIQNRFSTIIKTSLKNGKGNSFAAFDGLDIQKDYPLERLLLTQIEVCKYNNHVEVIIPITGGTVKAYNKIVSHFYFQLVLLWGNVFEPGALRVESTTSALYNINSKESYDCILRLDLPDVGPRMLLLKLCCLEGNELAVHPKHYGMRVIEYG